MLMTAAIDVAIVGDDREAAMVDRPDFALLAKGRRWPSEKTEAWLVEMTSAPIGACG